MAKIIADRVLETTTSTGTGTLVLAGAVAGYRSCSGAGIANGDTIDLYIEAVDARGVPTGNWECGTYTWSTGDNLARTTILASSNANAAVNFAAGTKRVGGGLLAYMLTEVMKRILTRKPIAGTTGTVAAGEEAVIENVAATVVTGPAVANVGDRIRVTVTNGLSTNKIDWNGLEHDNSSEADTEINDPFGSYEWVYQGSGYGWKLQK